MATARTVYRDFSTDGVPSSGRHIPKKSDIREYLTGLETIINAFTSSGGLVFQTRAALYADLAHGANSMAWVVQDPDPAKNGIYQKSGASGAGAWAWVADLPHGLIPADDVGAGTPNAIQATTATTVTEAALVLLGVYEANTGSPVTVAFNGGTAVTIKTVAGGDVPVGGLTAGLAVLGRMSGSTFRLLSDASYDAVMQERLTATTQAKADAQDAAQSASTDATAAAAAASTAVTASSTAVAAAEASGASRIYDTKAQASADIASIANLEVVEVSTDEDYGGDRTRYRKEGGALVFKRRLDLTGDQIVSRSFTPTSSSILRTIQSLLEQCVTPYLCGAIGDGVTDDYSAIVETATYCVSTGRPMFIDRTYKLASKWTPPAGLTLRGIASDDAALLYTGADDVGVEITAAIDIDGIVVDEGYTGARDIASNGSLIAIHGDMSATPAYLTGVKIGQLGLRARRTKKAGIVVMNVSGLDAGLLSAEDVFNHGILCAGLINFHIGKTRSRNIGDLQKNGNRRGTGFLFAADPKNFGTWYLNGANVLPSHTGQIGQGITYGTTDSAFYMHDDAQTGIEGIHIGDVDVQLSGKDGCKIRTGLKDIKIGTGRARKVANCGLTMTGENGYLSTIDRCEDISVGSFAVSEAGYDAIADITGVTHGTTRYVDSETAGTSINDLCYGVYAANIDRLTIGSASIEDVAAQPTGAAGHGIQLNDCPGAKIAGKIFKVAGRALQIINSPDVSLDISETDSGNPDAGGFTSPTPVTNATCMVIGSSGRLQLHTKQPTKRLAYPIYADASILDCWINDARAQYNLDVNAVYLRVSNGGAINYINPPRQVVGASLTFANVSGVDGISSELTHSIPGSVVPFITAVDVGAQPRYMLKPYSVTAKTAGGTFRLSLSADAAQVNATRTVRYIVEAVPHSTGWC